MKVLVIYDSAFGNTEKIAKAIAGALGAPEDVGIFRPYHPFEIFWKAFPETLSTE